MRNAFSVQVSQVASIPRTALRFTQLALGWYVSALRAGEEVSLFRLLCLRRGLHPDSDHEAVVDPQAVVDAENEIQFARAVEANGWQTDTTDASRSRSDRDCPWSGGLLLDATDLFGFLDVVSDGDESGQAILRRLLPEQHVPAFGLSKACRAVGLHPLAPQRRSLL